jgi:NOL1/NOP2/fmu family ribosome biogenesis protein
MAPADNQPHQFDRLPATAEEREVEGRPTRSAVIEWWDERFGIDPETFEHYTFWERGAGKIWAFRDDFEQPTPVEIEGLGMVALRARQEHWKPTTEAVQRWGRQATKNVIRLEEPEAELFLAGEDQALDWDGDWGYLIGAHDVSGGLEPIGIGLYVHGELQSTVPKGRQREF